MQNYSDSSLITSISNINPYPINQQNIELKEQTNQNENHFDTLPMLINQITPSKIHIIPNTVINQWGTFPHNVECPFCYVSASNKGENFENICEIWKSWIDTYPEKKERNVTYTLKPFQIAIGEF